MQTTTLGFIGAGQIGSQVARLAVACGLDVVLSNSRGPETLAALVAELGPRARAATVLEAACVGEIVFVSIPFKVYRTVPAEPLAGKVVVDTNNYYPSRDGRIRELEEGKATTSEMLQAHLAKSKVVKALNHIYAADLTRHNQPRGSPGRRALAIAGDYASAKGFVTEMLDDFGFDVVDLGPLSESWRIERDTPGYASWRNADQLKKNLADARRLSSE